MKTKHWLIVCLLLLLGALFLHLFLFRDKTEEDLVAHIYQDNQLVKSISLSPSVTPHSFTLTTATSGENLVLVEPGRISIQGANCPDQICVRQGAISHSGVPIVCLPNRLVISIVANQNSNIDTTGG